MELFPCSIQQGIELKNPGSLNLTAWPGPENATCWLFLFENQMSTCNYSYLFPPSNVIPAAQGEN